MTYWVKRKETVTCALRDPKLEWVISITSLEYVYSTYNLEKNGFIVYQLKNIVSDKITIWKYYEAYWRENLLYIFLYTVYSQNCGCSQFLMPNIWKTGNIKSYIKYIKFCSFDLFLFFVFFQAQSRSPLNFNTTILYYFLILLVHLIGTYKQIIY